MKRIYTLLLAVLVAAGGWAQASWQHIDSAYYPYYPGGSSQIWVNHDTVYVSTLTTSNSGSSVEYQMDLARRTGNNWQNLYTGFYAVGTYPGLPPVPYSMAFGARGGIYEAYLQRYYVGSNRYINATVVVEKYNEVTLNWDVFVNAATGALGPFCTAVMDNNDNLYVAYEDSLGGSQIKVKKFSGTAGTVVDSFAGTSDYAVMAVHKPSNTVYMAYRDSSHLNFASVVNVNTGALVGPAGFTGETIYTPSLSVDSAGNLFLSYVDSVARIYVWKFDGTAWTAFPLVGSLNALTDVGNQTPNISVAPDNLVYIAFTWQYHLRVLSASTSGGPWSNISFTNSQNTGFGFPSLATDEQSNVYVCLHNQFNTGDTSIIERYQCLPDIPQLTAINSTICSGGQATLQLTGVLRSATHWAWYADSSTGAPVDSGTSIIVAPAVTTTYFVKGLGGCSVQDSSGVVTVVADTLANAAITITASADTICAKLPVIFTALTVNGGSAPVYLWKKNGFAVGANHPEYADSTLRIGDTITCHLISSMCTANYEEVSNAISVFVVGQVHITASGPLTFCQGDSITLSTDTGAASYLWSTGATGAAITVLSTGRYGLSVNMAGCASSDSVAVLAAGHLLAPVITASGPLRFCTGGSITLNAGPGYDSYLWSTGQTTQSITQNISGNLTVNVNQGSCTGSATDTVVVGNFTIPVQINAGAPLINACTGDTVLLDAGAGYDTYLWSTGAQTQRIYVAAADTFSVTVTRNGCTGNAVVRVNFNNILPLEITAAGNVFLLGVNGTLTLATSHPYTGYLWSNGATTPTITVNAVGVYAVTVSQGGCTTSGVTPLINNPNPYRPFVIESAHWAIDQSICDFRGSCDAGMGTYITDIIHHFYKLEGDTVIGSITYKKMYHTYWTDGYPIWGTIYPPAQGIYGYLRDDTIARKVYWIPVGSPQCNTDSIFLDFSHQVGDTFNMNFAFSSDGIYCTQDRFSVDNMDLSGFESYQVRTKYLYNYHVNWGVIGNLGNLRLFEGIGFSTGFLVEYGGGDGNVEGSWLISYCVGPDAECPSAINNIAPPVIDVTLIPNPATDIVKIKTTGALIIEVEILDMNGRRVLTTPQSEVDVSNLAPAIYFVMIHTNLGIARRKLVKD